MGGFNGTYYPVLWQPKFDLLWSTYTPAIAIAVGSRSINECRTINCHILNSGTQAIFIVKFHWPKAPLKKEHNNFSILICQQKIISIKSSK